MDLQYCLYRNTDTEEAVSIPVTISWAMVTPAEPSDLYSPGCDAEFEVLNVVDAQGVEHTLTDEENADVLDDIETYCKLAQETQQLDRYLNSLE